MAPRTPTGERGYTLAVLVGILTVMGIALGAAVPHWVRIAEREREDELIARGFQYAEAIRVFQKRFGRFPNRLEELVEVEPRSIRRLWEDPMPDGGWLVLMEGPGGEIVPLDPETGEVVAGAGSGESGESEDEGFGETDGTDDPRRPGASTSGGRRSSPPRPSSGEDDGSGISGPIHGVKSRARRDAYRVLFDQKDVGDWEFTVERLVAATAATAPDGLPRRAHYGILGRPFRFPPPGGLPGATQGAPTAARPGTNQQPPPAEP